MQYEFNGKMYDMLHIHSDNYPQYEKIKELKKINVVIRLNDIHSTYTVLDYFDLINQNHLQILKIIYFVSYINKVDVHNLFYSIYIENILYPH